MGNKLPQQPTWSAIKDWVNSFTQPKDIWYNFKFFKCITWAYAYIWILKDGVLIEIELQDGSEDYADWSNNYKSLMNKN